MWDRDVMFRRVLISASTCNLFAQKGTRRLENVHDGDGEGDGEDASVGDEARHQPPCIVGNVTLHCWQQEVKLSVLES